MESNLIFLVYRKNAAFKLIQNELEMARNNKESLPWWKIETYMALSNYRMCKNHSVFLGPSSLWAKVEKQPVHGVVKLLIPTFCEEVYEFLKDKICNEEFFSFYEMRQEVWKNSQQRFWLDLSFNPEPGTPTANLTAQIAAVI